MRPAGPLKGRPRKGAREGWPCSKAVAGVAEEVEKWARREGEWVAKAVVRDWAAVRRAWEVSLAGMAEVALGYFDLDACTVITDFTEKV